MKSLRNLVLLVVIAYLIWRYVLNKPAVSEPVPASDEKKPSADPVKYAEQTIKEVAQVIDQKFPQYRDETSQILSQVQKAVDEYERAKAEAEKVAQQNLPILIPDNAVTTPPPEKDPARAFVPVNSSPVEMEVKLPKLSPLVLQATKMKEKLGLI